MVDLTGEEQIEAANALVAWLKSQDISPKEAGPVLALVIGFIIANRAEDRPSMDRGLTVFQAMLRNSANLHFDKLHRK